MRRFNVLDEPFVYVIICAVGAILYFKSLAFGFSYLDDNVLILNNIPFLENLGNIFQTFTQGVFAAAHNTEMYYRPFLTISFMPEAALGGAIPFLYHFGNVGIHLVSACLVFLLFIKLKYSKPISFLSAMVFVVHPVLTQAVSWIPGRNDSLLAVFVLASFICFLKFIGEKKDSALFLSIFFFACALFTKETAFVVPLLSIGYLWAHDALKKTTIMPLGIGWFSAIGVWFSLRLIALAHQPPMPAFEMASSFLKNIPGTLHMIGKVFFPFNLSVLPNLQNTTSLWGIAVLACIAVLVVFQVREKHESRQTYLMMLFGIAWFILFLWPSFVRPNLSITPDFMEHRLYLPIIGIGIFIAESRAGRCLDGLKSRWCIIVWLAVILIFASITFIHQDVFSTRLTFWQNAVKYSPDSPLAQKNLGAMYYLDQDYSLAEIYSRKALALNPEETMVHNNLGLIYVARGQFKEAEQEYLAEISFNPYYDDAHYNFGLLYYHMGDFINARKQWEETLRVNPNYVDAWRALQTLNAEGK